MNPENRARQDIDSQLVQCGWVVQDKNRLGHTPTTGANGASWHLREPWVGKSWPIIGIWGRGFSLAREFSCAKLPI